MNMFFETKTLEPLSMHILNQVRVHWLEPPVPVSPEGEAEHHCFDLVQPYPTGQTDRGTSLIRNRPTLGTYRRPMPRVLT